MKFLLSRLGVPAAVLVAAVLLPASPAFPQATCNGLIDINYSAGPGINFLIPGDVVRVQLQIGTGSINPVGDVLSVSALRFDLACDSSQPLIVGCTPDPGQPMQYQGDTTITSTCGGVTWASGHPAGTLPNEIVFTPTPNLLVPANQAVPPGFCDLEFDIKLLGPSGDATPALVQQVAGYLGTDAMCNNGLDTGGFQSAALPLCPVCSGTDCTTNACNQTTGLCAPMNVPDSTPCPDSDSNACTTAGCESGVCVQTHMTKVCPPSTTECMTANACDPTTGGCTFTNVPDSTPCTDSDGNACTTAGCEMGNCVQGHITKVCPPSTNECQTANACDPTTGTCGFTNVADSTPCTDTDGNACTTAGCEAGTCIQTHQNVVCPPSTDECKVADPCDPGTGTCPLSNKPDSTPCTDSDNDACTTAGCEVGTCVQTHQTTVCPPSTNECLENPGCNPADGTCPHPPVPDSTPCTDTDNVDCTVAGCEMGTCIQAHISSCNLATRTVGFWKNHVALTKSIVTATPLTVCGQVIDDVAINDAHSALEAMCGPANTNFEFQCCRQLMAAALNGAAGGAAFSQLAACNTICGDPTSSAAAVQSCESAADTFNGSGDNLNFPPGSPGAAHTPTNSGPCDQAAATPCLIIEPQRAVCKIQ
jgi:hypothetical protein